MTHSETLKRSTDTDMDQKENLLDKDLTLAVVLPGDVEKTATVHGSKPVMDLLVLLCAKYRLSPSSHTIELVSANGDRIKFNPNALIGAMEVEKILIKPKGMADKSKKQGPQMPEATVRLVINYKKTHKTVLRVNPRIPLKELVPAISGKCELDQNTTILLRGSCSEEPLDLTQSLNHFGLRELFATDQKGVNSVASPTHGAEDKSLPSKAKVLKEKENKGLFSIFRRTKKKPDQAVSASAPASPGLIKDKASSMTCLSASASTRSSDVTRSDVPKKRRAPLPPMTSSQSVPSDLSGIQINSEPDGAQEESGIPPESRKRSKRRAPAPPSPPCMSTPEEPALDEGIKVVALGDLEEVSEEEELASTTELGLSAAGGNSSAGENSDGLSVSVDALANCGGAEPVSSPADTEMPDASLSQGVAEEQPSDLSSDVSTDGSPAGERTGEPHPPGEDSQEHSPGTGSDLHTAPTSSATATPSSRPETLDAGSQASSVQADSEGVCGEESEALPVEDDSRVPSPGGGFLIGAGDRASPVASPEQGPHRGEGPPVSTEEPPAPHIEDAQPETKPPCELTRQHPPRAGLTTYTIVPSKSMEKLKYFEVELTLEDPAVALKEKEAVGSAEPGDRDAVTDESASQPEPLTTEGPEPTSGTATGDNADHDHVASALSAPAPEAPGADCENGSLPSPDDGGTQAGPAQEVTGKKTPPALKPKPDAVHLAQHKGTPGGYVVSAAMKNVSAISERGQKEESAGIEEEDGFPPPSPSPPPYSPPPPPVEREEEATERPQKEDEEEEKYSIPPSLPPLSPPPQSEQEATEEPQKEENSVPPSFPSPPPSSPLPPPLQREEEATEGHQEEEEEDSFQPSFPSPPPYPPLPPPLQREQEANKEPQKEDSLPPSLPSPPPYPPLPPPLQREQEARGRPQKEEEVVNGVSPAAPSPPPNPPPVQREQEAREEPQEEESFSPRIPSPPPYPAPPPPVQKRQEAQEGPQEEEEEDEPKSSEMSVPGDFITRCPAKERPAELSLEKLTSFAAPKPYAPAGPSRFTLAVSSAVKKHLAPQARLHTSEAGSKMLEGEAQEGTDDKAWAFRVEVEPGRGSGGAVPARGSDPNDPGEARTMSRDDAEPRMDEATDSLAVPDTLSSTSLSGSTEAAPTQEDERYLSPSCHMTPLDHHGRN